jgi:pilus assembly protein Flp/PilA
MFKKNYNITHNQSKKEKQDMKKLMTFLREEDGVTAIEYGLIAAGIGIAIVVAVGLVGDQLNVLFNQVVTELTGV